MLKWSILLMVSFVFFAGEIVASDKKSENVNIELHKGEHFQHPTPSDECHGNEKCMEEAPEKCKNKKAKLESCTEQYKGTWITTCECL